MNAALVKVDVACADLQQGVRVIERMVDGGDLVLRGLVWVFDFANDLDDSARRELRFWRPELLARAAADSTKQHKYSNWELDWVIAQILPSRRKTFQAGEVDQLFQIRHNTRLAFGAELNGDLRNGANTYGRDNLARFLQRRWLGNCYDRRQDAGANNFHPVDTAKERDNGRGKNGDTAKAAGQSPNKALSQSLKKVATAG